ncbi:hypothetical protein GIB67_009325 [Kingdonia uniflora]|uniref:Uncharacterized protein n=1 Tax=Kingdonia uniflora TaxID=39325 RepID=A0A7J7N2V7_9MAGN|nr:hypothetical protein GIB67_009325 [Kingdonia uniflora]
MEGGDRNEWVSISSTGARWVLNLEKRTCQCIEWQLTGMPFIFYHITLLLDMWLHIAVLYIQYLMKHTGALWRSTNSGRASNAGRGRGRSASTPIAGGVQTTPITRERGSSGRASNTGRGRGRCTSTPIAGGVQTTPIAGGRGSSGRASNAGRRRGRSVSIPIVGQVQTRSRRAFNAGGVQTRSGKSSNAGRGWESSEGAASSSNAGRGKGRAMQTNHQRFVDEWLSNSVPVEALQSQERPPLVIPPMPPRTDAPVKPYKKAFKPPRDLLKQCLCYSL